ncbi:hypothetical protein E6O75_ATG00020 [Venturia nashicola]|uniref:Uncharacterized protein n=1 Tax=Venturia nashicola TaxID=86259 RepID=A0A4Z1PEB4_9PEZI|nr:hypothetical protein E6O75_ATG00020 [Venturia nashicola]
MALKSKSLYYATLSLGTFTFVALTCLALSDFWRRSSLAVTATTRRSVPNITTVCPITPPASDEYQVHLSHINNTIEEFCSLPRLQKTSFVPAIYTFPPWPGVRSVYPNKGEEYPLPDSGVRLAIGFSDDKTLEGKCENGWAFEKNACIEGLRKKWEGGCNITSGALPDPATLQAMASTPHQAKATSNSTSTSKRNDQAAYPSSECISFHLSSAPPSENTNSKSKPRPKNFHLDVVFTDSSRFSMDEQIVVCSPERKDLIKGQKGWCNCWFEGLEGQKRRFWPANGDMMCWNLVAWIWTPKGRSDG